MILKLFAMSTIKTKPVPIVEHHQKTVKAAKHLLVFLADNNNELYKDIADLFGGNHGLKKRFEKVVINLKNLVETPYENK